MASPGLKPAPRWLQAPDWKRQTIVRGQTLFGPSEPNPQVFVLETGLVKLTRTDPGDTDPFVQLVYPGHLFGDPICPRGKRDTHPVEASCLCSGAVYSTTCDRFFEACREVPELWNWLLAQMATRVDRVERRMHQLMHWRVEDRILWLLADIASVLDKGSGRVDVPLAQYEIAQQVAATRETVSTILNNLQRRGTVELGRGFVRVLSVREVRQQLTDAGTV